MSPGQRILRRGDMFATSLNSPCHRTDVVTCHVHKYGIRSIDVEEVTGYFED